MPAFTPQEIENAKQRAWEMRNKAAGISPVEKSGSNINSSSSDTQPVNTQKQVKKSSNNKDNSSMMILALIILLSHEGADNALILALLYLLL